MLFGCTSFVQSFALSTFPPRGRHEAADNFCLIVRKHDEARGSREAADNFCLIVREHDEARGSLRMLPKKMKFTEFFSGKGKALKEIIFYKEKGGFLYAKNM